MKRILTSTKWTCCIKLDELYRRGINDYRIMILSRKRIEDSGKRIDDRG